jgi:hypothetical protein
MIILTITLCSLTQSYWTACALQTAVSHSLSNIRIYIFQYPFPVALGVNSTRKFLNTCLNIIQLHSLNEYVCDYNICIKKPMPSNGLELADGIFTSALVFYSANFAYMRIWMFKRRIVFTFVLQWNLVTLIGIH